MKDEKKLPWHKLATDEERQAAFEAELEKSSSQDPLIHIAWLVQGLQLFERSKGKSGHSLQNTQRFVVANVLGYVGQAIAEELSALKEKTTDLGTRLAIDRRLKELGVEDVK